ncbi:MAG: helix-turn-helix transcriptional regulator [Roseibium sp.]
MKNMEAELLRTILKHVTQSDGWNTILDEIGSQLGCRAFLAEYLPDGSASNRYGGLVAASELAGVLSAIKTEYDRTCLQFLTTNAELNFPYCKMSLSSHSTISSLPNLSPAEAGDDAKSDLASAPGLIAPLRRVDGNSLLLACLFPGQSPTSLDIDETVAVFKKISQVVTLGWETSDVFQDLSEAKMDADTVLETVTSCAVLIDGERNILSHTSQGLRVLAENDLANLQNDVLTIRCRHMESHLQNVMGLNDDSEQNHLADSLQNRQPGLPQTDFCFRNNAGEIMRIVIEDVGQRSLQTDRRDRTRLLIHVLRPVEIPDGVEDLLQEEFGLSQSEAHLARMLTLTGSTAETSKHLGITRNTTKTHLRRIFEKTGLHTQLELTRLVHQIAGLTQPLK